MYLRPVNYCFCSLIDSSGSSVFIRILHCVHHLPEGLPSCPVGFWHQPVSARNARNTIMLHAVQLLICMLSYITPFINVILVYAWPRDRTKILLATFLFTNVLPRLLSLLIYSVRDEKLNRHLRMNFSFKCFNPVNKRVKLILGAQRKPKQASL